MTVNLPWKPNTPDLVAAARSVNVLRDARAWQRPSDHVPVLAAFS